MYQSLHTNSKKPKRLAAITLLIALLVGADSAQQAADLEEEIEQLRTSGELAKIVERMNLE